MEADELFDKEIKIIQEILNDGDIHEVQKLRQTKTFAILLAKKGTDLISSISSFLNDKRLYKCPDNVICYEEILKVIAEEIDPEDSFITFLEQLDEETCFLEKCILLLPPLKIPLLRLAESRGYWLEWSFNTIKYYLDTLSAPEDHQVELDVKIMLTNDKYLDSVLTLCKVLLNFLDAFVDNYISEREKDTLIVFGLHILTKPAMYIYVEKFKELQQFHASTIAIINKLTAKLPCYLDYLDERYLSNMEKEEFATLDTEGVYPSVRDRISATNLAVYYAAVIDEEPFLQYFPQVYERLYLFHKLLFLCVVLLRHSHNAVVRKGVILSMRVLNSMSFDSIPYYYLEYRVHQEFIKIISSISVYSCIFENRRDAIQLVLPYIRKFDAQGRYMLYMNISSATNNPDVDGEIITSFRNSWYVNFMADSLEFYQKGKLLIDLLKSFCLLPDRSDTDMMLYKNKILSVIYLFALLMKRDMQNVTGLDDHFEYFEKTFFCWVTEAIKKSRRNFNEELLYLSSGTRRSEHRDNPLNVIVDGQSLPRLRREEHMTAISGALTALDVIDHAMKLVYEYAKRQPPKLL